MPVLLLVIHIQSVCRKAILICLIPIVAGVSNCGRCYHIYGGITFFEGSAPKNEVKKEALIFFKDFILYTTISWRCIFISWRLKWCHALLYTLILTASHFGIRYF